MWCRCSCCSLGLLDFLENAVIFWKVPSLVHSPISDTGSMLCFSFLAPRDFRFRVNFPSKVTFWSIFPWQNSAFDPFDQRRNPRNLWPVPPVLHSTHPLGLHEAPGIGRSGRPHEFEGQRYDRWGLRGGSKVEAKPQKDAEKSHL